MRCAVRCIRENETSTFWLSISVFSPSSFALLCWFACVQPGESPPSPMSLRLLQDYDGLLLKILFSLSALGKVKALVGPTGHPLFGPGKLYPSWFLPIALSTELLFVGGLVFMQDDDLLPVAIASTFLGGIVHAQTSPEGPFSKVGAKALVPGIIAGCLLASRVNRVLASAEGPSTSFVGMSVAGALATGFGTGIVLGMMNSA